LNSGGNFEIVRNTHDADGTDKLCQKGLVRPPSIGSAWGNQEWEEIPRKCLQYK
jgi:hypothetical protein